MLITEIAPEHASMYSRPSLSQIRIPSPRTASGSSPRRSCWSHVGAVIGRAISPRHDRTRRMPVTRDLATFASVVRFEELPDDVVESVKIATLNIVACCLGGAGTRLGRLHIDLAKQI